VRASVCTIYIYSGRENKVSITLERKRARGSRLPKPVKGLSLSKWLQEGENRRPHLDYDFGPKCLSRSLLSRLARSISNHLRTRGCGAAADTKRGALEWRALARSLSDDNADVNLAINFSAVSF